MTTSSVTTSTSSGLPASGAQDSTNDSTTQQAKDQAKHVAGVATDEAKSVAGDVRQQAKGLLDETRYQVEDQSRTQRDRLVQTLQGFSADLDDMAQQRSGLASDAAREVANRARSFSQQLDGREPAELLDDLRAFARRRPGLFLAGAAVSGVLVGRMLRGARDANQDSTVPQQTTTGYGTDTEITVGDPTLSAYDPTAPVAAPVLGETSGYPMPTGTTGTTADPAYPSESGRPAGGL